MPSEGLICSWVSLPLSWVRGFVGAITAQCAKCAGALPIIVTDLDEERLDMARKMGVDFAINPAKEPEKSWPKSLNPLDRGGCPVIFEATGSRQPLEQAFELVSERGRGRHDLPGSWGIYA